MKNKQYYKLFKNWNDYLLLESNVNVSKKQAVDKLSNIEVYYNDVTLHDVVSFINSSSSNDWSNFKKYFNILIDDFNIQEDSTDTQKYLLFKRVEICMLHAQKIFHSMSTSEKNNIINGEYSVFELEEELSDQAEKSGVKKTSSNFWAFNSNHSIIIYKDSNIIIVKPITTLGSIVWARGMYDGSREKDNKEIRGKEINWCTAITSENNQFVNYFNEDKLNLYYIIKNISIYDKEDNYRKVCVSFGNFRGQVDLSRLTGTIVDSENLMLSGVTKSNISVDKISRVLSKGDQNLYDSYKLGINKCFLDSSKDNKILERAREFNWRYKDFIDELSIIDDTHLSYSEFKENSKYFNEYVEQHIENQSLLNSEDLVKIVSKILTTIKRLEDTESGVKLIYFKANYLNYFLSILPKDIFNIIESQYKNALLTISDNLIDILSYSEFNENDLQKSGIVIIKIMKKLSLENNSLYIHLSELL